MEKNGIYLGFVFTNFNNSALTLNAIKSIFNGYKGSKVSDFLIVIVDNLSKEEELIILKNGLKQVDRVILIESKKNLGYFPGLNEGIKYFNNNYIKADILIIGNNDLVFPKEFFKELNTQKINHLNRSVICPNLVTLDGEKQNPHVSKDISRFREIVWDLYFSNYYIGCLISFMANKLKRWVSRKDFKEHEVSGDIYQGYGACYILTNKFFRNYETLWSPGFLNGEEFHLAIQLEEIGETMYYMSNLVVIHHDHASTSELPKFKMWTFEREAHLIYRKFYNPYKLKMRSALTMKQYQHMIEKTNND